MHQGMLAGDRGFLGMGCFTCLAVGCDLLLCASLHEHEWACRMFGGESSSCCASGGTEQPERNLRRLHGFLHKRQQLLAQDVRVYPGARESAKVLDQSSGILFAAVQATPDDLLCALS